MGKRVLFFVCFISICSHAHHQAYLDTTYLQKIGDATVSTTHDRYYDNYYWDLTYRDQSSQALPAAALVMNVSSSEKEGFAASFIFESAPNPTQSTVKLEYQFDDGESTSTTPKVSTLNERHFVVKFEKKDFQAFLENLATADVLTFVVWDTEQVLKLKNLEEAVKDYRGMLFESQLFEMESESDTIENPEKPPIELDPEAQDLREA